MMSQKEVRLLLSTSLQFKCSGEKWETNKHDHLENSSATLRIKLGIVIGSALK